MRIAKVIFGLMSDGKKSGKEYLFNTDLENLEYGDIVVVDSKGKEALTIFVGYYNGQKEAFKSILCKANEHEINKYWTDVEYKLLKSPLRVEPRAYEDYRTRFKDNINISIEEARLKLTRNVLLANNFNSPRYEHKRLVFNYGTMQIETKGNTVVDIYVNMEYKDSTIDNERKEYIESKLNGIKLSDKRKAERYNITPPTKDELTSKGFTNKIKVSHRARKDTLMKYGFTNAVEDTLYYCTMVGREISFNMSVNAETLEIKSIDVLDEDFLQPYDYQSMLMRDINFTPARQVFDRVDRVLSNMQSANIITGYERGMYV